MAWIESHQSLARHPKLARLAATLKISRPTAIGHLHLLWWWCIDYTIDGDLAAFSTNEIAAASAWEGDAAAWRSAIEAAGFVDPDARIHDWHDYAGRLVLLREARREAGRIGGIKSGAARRSVLKQRLKQTPSTALKQNTVLLEAPTNQPNQTKPTVPTRASLPAPFAFLSELGQLFGRAKDHWPDDPEMRAACEILKRPAWQSEQVEICAFYAKVAEADRRYELPSSLNGLLENWNKTLDKSKTYGTRSKTDKRNHTTTPSDIRNSHIIGADAPGCKARDVIDARKRRDEAERAAKSAANGVAAQVAGSGGNAP